MQATLAQRARVDERYLRCGDAFYSTSIACRTDDGCTLVTPGKPLLRFSSTLAGERDHDGVRTAAFDDPLEQCRLTATGGAEDTYACSASKCE